MVKAIRQDVLDKNRCDRTGSSVWASQAEIASIIAWLPLKKRLRNRRRFLGEWRFAHGLMALASGQQENPLRRVFLF